MITRLTMNQPKRTVRRILRLLGTPLVLVIVLQFLAGGCNRKGDAKEGATAAAEQDAKKEEHKDEVKLSAEAVTKYGIKVEEAKRQPLVRTLVAPARVSFNADTIAHVGAVLRGRVVELKVKKGDRVRKGDELLLIESPELGEAQSDYLQKRTAVAIATPAVEFAKSAYDRAKGLYDGSKGITLTELQKREGELKAAQGVLQSAEAALTGAENKLHLLGMNQEAVKTLNTSKEIFPRYPVTAPIDGQVIDREVTLGELVSPEKEALLVIADTKTLWVLADVPEARLKDVRVGNPARVSVSAVGAGVVQGKVSLIDAALDPNTRSARVRVEVNNDAGSLRPGMFAQAEIVADAGGGNAESAVAIPEEAVQTVEGHEAVFVPVKGEDNTFTKRLVTVGTPANGMVPVLAGLQEGERLVTAASFILKAELGKGSAEED